MNLPNKLTTLRVLMIPVFLVFMLMDVFGEADKWVALGLFLLASVTDYFDGYLARKNHLVTNFGKLVDPLADKLLICSALICLAVSGQITAIAVIIIICREFIISGFRLVASDSGIVISASWWGKSKTVAQMVMIGVLIADFGGVFDLVGLISIHISVTLTIISLVDYIWKNRQLVITYL